MGDLRGPLGAQGVEKPPQGGRPLSWSTTTVKYLWWRL
jgi:hypothetical protein